MVPARLGVELLITRPCRTEHVFDTFLHGPKIRDNNRRAAITSAIHKSHRHPVGKLSLGHDGQRPRTDALQDRETSGRTPAPSGCLYGRRILGPLLDDTSGENVEFVVYEKNSDLRGPGWRTGIQDALAISLLTITLTPSSHVLNTLHSSLLLMYALIPVTQSQPKFGNI